MFTSADTARRRRCTMPTVINRLHRKDPPMKTNAIIKRLAALILSAMMLAVAAVPAFARDAVVTDCCEGLAPGDVNGDGSVDLKDAFLMIRHCAGFDDGIDLGNADVRNDGEVTMKDVSLLLRVLAGISGVRLGHLDGYGKCALCGSYAEYFDPDVSLREWFCDADMSGPFHDVTLRNSGYLDSGEGFHTTAYYNDLSGYIELSDYVWDFDRHVNCVLTPGTEPGEAWTVLYEECVFDIENYEDIAAGTAKDSSLVTLTGYIDENGTFCIDPIMLVDFMDTVCIPEDKLGEYEHQVAIYIGHIADAFDEVFGESGVPLNSKDIRLK